MNVGPQVPATISFGGAGPISYAYDASDQRYRQVSPSDTALYWNAAGVTSEQFTATGVTSWRSYVVAEGHTVVVGIPQTAPLWNSGNWGAN
jgi:YD repeat-containing protein